MKKYVAVGSLAGLAFLANPALFACSSSSEEDQDFTYGEAQMKAAVLGEWQGTAELDGESVVFTLTLEQASAKSSTQSISAPSFQPQCGSRSFVKPAAACISMSTMPLTGTIASEHPLLNGEVTGEVTAYRTLESGNLELELEDGTRLGGNLEEPSVVTGEVVADAPLGTFSLSRS